MTNDRDKLIELIRKGIQEFGKSTVKCSADEYIADYLLANNVIVPHIGKLYSEIKTEAYKEFANLLDEKFAIIKNKLPNNKLVKQTIQTYQNIIKIALKELVGE